MANFWRNLTTNWQDSVNLLLGVWLFASGWILAFTAIQFAFWNSLIFGVVLALMAFAALISFKEWEEWVDMLVGVWLIVSPWMLGFAEFTREAGGAAYAATWNFLTVGIVTFALAAWSVRDHRHRESEAH